MFRSRFVALSLAFAMLGAAADADAKRRKKKAPDDGLPAPADVAEQIRSVYADLAQNSNPLVRNVVYFGELELEKEDIAQAVERGLAESDWTIKSDAMGKVLTTRDRKLKAKRKEVEKALTALLESAEAEDREQGYALLMAHKNKKAQLKAIQSAAKLGSPDARAEARKRLIEMGGKTAWKVISAGLAEPAGEPEHTQAVEALKSFRDPVALKWAMGKLHAMDDMGEIARTFLIEVSGKKVDRKLNTDLAKRYKKAQGEFEDRLRLARIRAARGAISEVTTTLLAGLRYRAPWAKVMAWQGLQASRDHAVLGKLRPKMMLLLDEDQADAAFGWLESWAKQNADRKVIEFLQEAARSDRPAVRFRAMSALTDVAHRPSVVLFEGAMNEGRTEVRLAAAKGLASVARPGDEKRIASFLRKEPTAEVKLALIQGLANIGTPEIIDSLQFVLTDRNKEIKSATADALAATGVPKAAMLLGLLKRDADLEIRFKAWKALLVLGGPKEMAEFKGAALGWITGLQIEELGKEAKIDSALFEHFALKGNDEQRVFAVDALKSRGGAKSATKLLTIFEKSGDADTSSAALGALIELRGKDSLATYRKGLEAAQAEVRAVSFRAIGMFGVRTYLESLLSALADRDPLARAEAARAAYRVANRFE